MSNARDKANIPALNFSSTGIDDNATSTAITITSGENVGIGTSSPSAELHIYRGDGEGDANLVIETGTDSGSVEPGIYLKGYATNSEPTIHFGDRVSYPGKITYDNVDNHLHINTNGSERMRIDSSGRVGIANTIASSFNAFANDLVVGDGASSGGVTVYSGTSNSGNFNFADGTSGSQGYQGTVQYNHNEDALKFFVNYSGNASPRMIIDSSGNVGIGTSSPANKLDISATTWDDGLLIKNTGNFNTAIIADANRSSAGGAILNLASKWNGTEVAGILFQAGSDTTNKDDGEIVFRTASAGTPSERMRIDSSGNVLVGKTSPGVINQGGEIHNQGYGAFTVSGNVALYINRLVSDGELVRFFQDTNLEGNISVSGSTVSYNGFTGTHWSRFTDNSKPTILKGTVLETLDEMCDWYNLEFDVVTQDEDGNDVTTAQKIPHVLLDTQSNGDVITYNHEGTDYQATIVKEADIKHMKSKVSDTVDAKNVYGVFVAYDEDGEGYNDFYVASVGSFVVRIKANETIAKGDLLQSNGDGTAKVQTDDNVKSSSFAKVLSTTIIETYEDGSYLVPCSLMC